MSDHRSKVESSPAMLRSSKAPARAVGSFVPALTRKSMEKFGFSTAALFADWAQIVGADLASHTTPLRLRWPRPAGEHGDPSGESSGRSAAMLHLQVHAARALDIQYKSGQIVDRINAYFGYRAVAGLRILQAPIGPAAQTPMPRDIVQPKPSRAPAPLPELSRVGDDRLRELLAQMHQGISARS